jgi:hypothetical protein
MMKMPNDRTPKYHCYKPLILLSLPGAKTPLLKYFLPINKLIVK